MEESKILNEDNTKVPPSEFHFSLDSIVNEFEHFKHDFLEFVSLVKKKMLFILEKCFILLKIFKKD